MTSPAVLVLVPSYNHGAFIGDRVKSVLEQTHRNFELQVIDDSSNDQTMEVLSKFADKRIKVTQRAVNSGSPFTAWLDAKTILSERSFDYVWIAESDDRAEPDFLKRGVRALDAAPDASVYYCHSWFIDDSDLIIGHSINYLNRVFGDMDWNRGWQMPGAEFIQRCLIKGMAIPNMSSALIRAEAFTGSVKPSLARYKLAADWVFAIAAAATGDVIFDAWDGNHFRHHARTSRSETHVSRMLFEHMSATRTAYLNGGVDHATYAEQMRVWTRMFRRERVRITDFIRWGWKISRPDLTACLGKLAGI